MKSLIIATLFLLQGCQDTTLSGIAAKRIIQEYKKANIKLIDKDIIGLNCALTLSAIFFEYNDDLLIKKKILEEGIPVSDHMGDDLVENCISKVQKGQDV